MPYFYVHSARERLCHAGRLPEIYCNHTILNNAFHPKDLNDQELAKLFLQQKMDAIIYVLIVLLFYAAIITIVLVTNCHRFRNDNNPLIIPLKKQILVNSDSTMKILDPTKDVPNYSSINEESNV